MPETFAQYCIYWCAIELYESTQNVLSQICQKCATVEKNVIVAKITFSRSYRKAWKQSKNIIIVIVVVIITAHKPNQTISTPIYTYFALNPPPHTPVGSFSWSLSAVTTGSPSLSGDPPDTPCTQIHITLNIWRQSCSRKLHSWHQWSKAAFISYQLIILTRFQLVNINIYVIISSLKWLLRLFALCFSDLALNITDTSSVNEGS